MNPVTIGTLTVRPDTVAAIQTSGEKQTLIFLAGGSASVDVPAAEVFTALGWHETRPETPPA